MDYHAGTVGPDDAFFNLYNHDYVRMAVGVPRVRVADPAFNAEQTIALMRQAAGRRALLVLFPELGLSAYSCEDLFQQQALLDACGKALESILEASVSLPLVAVVGMPLTLDHLLYNCAVVLAEGRILGVIPKTYLPNYREFYASCSSATLRTRATSRSRSCSTPTATASSSASASARCSDDTRRSSRRRRRPA